MAKIKIGQRVQFWIGLSTVKAKVIGFSPAGEVIISQTYEGENRKTGRMEIIKEVYYRNKEFIRSLNQVRV